MNYQIFRVKKEKKINYNFTFVPFLGVFYAFYRAI